MDIQFFYQNNRPNQQKEVIITSFANALSKVIDLPNTIEVCLYPLGGNVYGGIDIIRVNRIGLDYDLPIEVLPQLLTHELIHVNQKHIGLLKIKSDGSCFWRGIFYTNKKPEDMTYEEYQNLPWELDVVQKQQHIFRTALGLT